MLRCSVLLSTSIDKTRDIGDHSHHLRPLRQPLRQTLYHRLRDMTCFTSDDLTSHWSFLTTDWSFLRDLNFLATDGSLLRILNLTTTRSILTTIISTSWPLCQPSFAITKTKSNKMEKNEYNSSRTKFKYANENLLKTTIHSSKPTNEKSSRLLINSKTKNPKGKGESTTNTMLRDYSHNYAANV